MGKVIAFDRSRLRSKPQSTPYAQRASSLAGSSQAGSSQVGARSSTRIHAFPQKKEEVQVSVVVPACGRPQLLSRCLGALLAQGLDPHRYEIIVVDAKPCTSTRDIANDWAHHASRNGPAISHISCHGTRGTAAARNRGWRAARGQVVAFIDEDVIVRSDWLEKGLDSFDGEVRAVWGRVMSPASKSPGANTVSLPPEQAASFETSNYFVRKDTLREVGGFDERFTSSWGEEADLYFRLSDQPARIQHHPRLIGTHLEPPASCGALLARQQRHVWDALLYKKHPQLYRRKISALPYRDFYLITAMLLLAAFGILSGAPALAGVAALAWTGLTFRFWRRQRHVPASRSTGFLSGVFNAILGPPAGVWWHLVGMLRFRIAYF